MLDKKQNILGLNLVMILKREHSINWQKQITKLWNRNI